MLMHSSIAFQITTTSKHPLTAVSRTNVTFNASKLSDPYNISGKHIYLKRLQGVNLIFFLMILLEYSVSFYKYMVTYM